MVALSTDGTRKDNFETKDLGTFVLLNVAFFVSGGLGSSIGMLILTEKKGENSGVVI